MITFMLQRTKKKNWFESLACKFELLGDRLACKTFKT